MNAPREINRADVLAELLHRFDEDDPPNPVEWVLDTLSELDILRDRAPKKPATAEDDAEFVYDSDLQMDGRAFLSLHRVSTAVHIRIRHSTDGRLTYRVAVVEHEDIRKVADALAALAEPTRIEWKPAPLSGLVPPRDEPARESQVFPFQAGDWVRNRCTGAVLQVGGDLADWSLRHYQLTDEPLPREPRVFASDGPEPPQDVRALEWLDREGPDDYRYLIRSGAGWLWSMAANRLEPDHRATPNGWRGAVNALDGRLREVSPA